ncbi:MAG: trans-aconitate 2-methyltransferase [Candidatus Babeliales bacterium]
MYMEPFRTDNLYQEALEHALELAGEQAAFFAEYQAHIITKILNKQGTNPATILDYGCGDGTMAYILSALLPQAQIQGVDTSDELIEIAQGWYGTKNEKLRFSKSFAGQFDIIYMANVLHHIQKDQRKNLLKTLTDHLAPNGQLIILEFNPFNVFEVWRFYRNKEEQGNHMILPCSIKKLLCNLGTTKTYYHKKIYAAVLTID